MTTAFGLERSALIDRVARVSAHSAALDAAGAMDRFARAAWSGIAEPGDRLAGLAIGALGAAGSLELVLSRPEPTALAGELRRHGETTVPEAAEALARWQPRLVSRQALLALENAARVGVRLLVPDDPEWPQGLRDLGPHQPAALWLRGRLDSVAALARSIALVGARASTGYGEHLAAEASAGLVDRGFTIVSGAAYGIDGVVHRIALASGGITVAFLAGGVDRFYPAGHDSLLKRVVEHGAVLSELPCGSAPTKWRFLQRNRLIAAASLAVVVLEAGWRSGSLNTAGHAAALGRPLGAVPGPVTSAASAGCHRLLRDFTAVCVTNAAEMAELATEPEEAVSEPTQLGDGERLRVLDALSTRASRDPEDLARRSGLDVDAVVSALGLLELDGRAMRRDTGWVQAPRQRDARNETGMWHVRNRR